MRITPLKFTSTLRRNLSFRILTVTSLIVVIFVGHSTGCDVCLRMPGIPFEVEDPSAIEVAMATQEAAEMGDIEWNPIIKQSLTTDRYTPRRLDKVTPRELVKFWSQTRPAKTRPAMRFTLELIFVDADRICHLDIRFGDVIDGEPGSGPPSIRVFTTKAGFYRLMEDGLESCEQRKLVAVELTDIDQRDELNLLFSMTTKNENSNSISAL